MLNIDKIKEMELESANVKSVLATLENARNSFDAHRSKESFMLLKSLNQSINEFRDRYYNLSREIELAWGD